MARVEIGPKDGYLGNVVTITLGVIEAEEVITELWEMGVDLGSMGTPMCAEVLSKLRALSNHTEV